MTISAVDPQLKRSKKKKPIEINGLAGGNGVILIISPDEVNRNQ